MLMRTGFLEQLAGQSGVKQYGPALKTPALLEGSRPLDGIPLTVLSQALRYGPDFASMLASNSGFWAASRSRHAREIAVHGQSLAGRMTVPTSEHVIADPGSRVAWRVPWCMPSQSGNEDRSARDSLAADFCGVIATGSARCEYGI